MMNAKAIFVDTNVLTRATIVTAPLHVEAQAALEQFQANRRDVWISQQIIREYLANATRPQTYSQPVLPERLLEQVKRFRSAFQIAEDTPAVMDHLMTLIEKVPLGGTQVHDANIVATMLAYGIPTLFTHNIVDFVRFSTYIAVLPLEGLP